jgi:glycerol-3-phosphate O-acyltransferase
MSSPPLTHPYVPNVALKALYERVFKHIQVEEGWADQVRELSKKGSVLYVLPNLNWLDFVALDYLTKQNNLPPLRYANDLGLWVLNPHGPNVPGQGLMNMLLPHKRQNPEEQLRDAIENDGSAALFLKRPPSVLDVAAGATGGRGMREGDALVRSIFETQREGKANIILLPLVFVWSKSPDKVGVSPWDILLGPRAWPTPTRALGQFAYNRKHASLRWGDPIDVGQVLQKSPEQSDEVLVRRITYMVLRRIERERRAVVGPAEKAPERVRAEIIRSPKLQSVISDLAQSGTGGLKEKISEASSMLEELQATPHQDVLKGMGVALRWGFNKIYRGIEFDQADVDRLREASRDGALILLPSHKSHIDYLVLSYFFYERNLMLPVIAAGDNLNFQPVGPIFRRCGAFFIRRSFKGDRLYAAVVDAYIRRLIRDGFPIEVFLEGGRSRTGKRLEPKLGLLNMIVDSALGVPLQKVHFVPVSIGYERVIEADSYQRELSGAEKKKEEASDLLSASEVLRHRYGRINLQFGSIMTLSDIGEDLGIENEDMRRPAKRRAVVTRLGNRVMDEINRVTAVTPGALTSMAVLSENHRTIKESEVYEISKRLLMVLRRLDARISSTMLSSSGDIRYSSIRESLQMFVEAQLLDASGETSEGGPASEPTYSIVESKRLQLDTSKNIIVHFFVERGLIASAFDRDSGGHSLSTDIAVLRERVRYASKLFKHEFRFRADAPFEEIFDNTVTTMVDEGHLSRDGDRLSPGKGESDWSGADWLRIYRSILAAFFEGYSVAARSLERLLGGPRSEKDLVKSGLALGHSLYLSDELSRREAISKPVLTNAYQSLSELGYLRSRSGKIQLQEAYNTRDALDELDATLKGYLTGRHVSPQ